MTLAPVRRDWDVDAKLETKVPWGTALLGEVLAMNRVFAVRLGNCRELSHRLAAEISAVPASRRSRRLPEVESRPEKSTEEIDISAVRDLAHIIFNQATRHKHGALSGRTA